MPGVTDEGLKHLTNITKLNLEHNRTITEESLSCLRKLEEMSVDTDRYGHFVSFLTCPRAYLLKCTGLHSTSSSSLI
jgi:hypothetical protein